MIWFSLDFSLSQSCSRVTVGFQRWVYSLRVEVLIFTDINTSHIDLIQYMISFLLISDCLIYIVLLAFIDLIAINLIFQIRLFPRYTPSLRVVVLTFLRHYCIIYYSLLVFGLPFPNICAFLQGIFCTTAILPTVSIRHLIRLEIFSVAEFL